MHRCRGMNVLLTSVSSVKLLTLLTDPIHPHCLWSSISKMTILLHLYKWKNVQRRLDRRVPALYTCEERYDTPREVSSIFFRDGIRHDDKCERDDWGLFKDELEIRGGKILRSWNHTSQTWTRYYLDQNYRGQRTRHRLLAGTCWRQQLSIHQPVSIANDAPSSKLQHERWL